MIIAMLWRFYNLIKYSQLEYNNSLKNIYIVIRWTLFRGEMSSFIFAVLLGPYLYELYLNHGFMESQIAIIYVSGIISSTIFFPAKDIITAKLGRCKTAAVFCVLYIISCLLTVCPQYGVLILGRVIAGLTNSILFSTLESWCAYEHLEHFDFPKEWLPITFSHVAFGSSIVAVLAGFLADVTVRWLSLGSVAPFLLAVPVFMGSIACLLLFWNENFSEKKEISLQDIQRSCREGLKQILQNVDLFLVGTIQSLFETVLFVFVFMWTPTLDAFHVVPLGIAFASFMVCFLLGGIVCDYLISKMGFTMTRLLVVVSSCSSIVFVMVAYTVSNKYTTRYTLKILIYFQVFELLCGFYFSIMRVLREKILPGEHRLSITNWFRVPLTLLSSMVLIFFHTASGGTSEIFYFCAMMMFFSFVCSLCFAWNLNRSEQKGNIAGM